MYSGGFYHYSSLEEMWAFQSRNIMMNRYENAPLPVYEHLYELVKNKDYFVLTTNVDHCFQKAGFDKRRLFYTQGDYGLFQCSGPCYQYTYDNFEVVKNMVDKQVDLKIPTELIPRCPICSRPMTMNLRSDDKFVQDDGWYKAAERYKHFVGTRENKALLLVELGVGFNTPGIIKYPFWQMTLENPKAVYVCVNHGAARAPKEIVKQSICINADIGDVLNKLLDNYGGGKKMTQEQRLDCLIEYFSSEAGSAATPYLKKDKKVLFRSLMNIRMPKAVPKNILKLQNDYLCGEKLERGIVELADIPTIAVQYGSTHDFADIISIWQGDITELEVDAIVNAAKPNMMGCFIPMHGCIDNCIHSYAGVQLRKECNKYMNKQKVRYGDDYTEPVGKAVLTKAYNLPAKYIIHTVGPMVTKKLTKKIRNDLKKCYNKVLDCCVANGIKSVAFCCISTGLFRFPNDEAAQIAVQCVIDFLQKNPGKLERVVFSVSNEVDKECYEALLA
jgi:O-acetyl-ADP-ribose deacetylase (regulator of RNase III)/NAD-dependent SIR2 family protein deacetylase